MKRVAVSLLSLLFLLSSVGLGFTWHTCGTTKSLAVNGVSVVHKCKCDHSHKRHTSSCCDDHNEYVKPLDDDYNRVLSNRFEQPPVVDIAVVANWCLIVDAPALSAPRQVAFKPPPEPDVSLNVLHCIFRV